MSTIRANQQLGQMDILGPMDIGADGHGHCWGRRGSGSWGLGFRVEGVGVGRLGSEELGTGGELE